MDGRLTQAKSCAGGGMGRLVGVGGSVVSALAFQSLILSSIPGRKPVFLIPSIYFWPV